MPPSRCAGVDAILASKRFNQLGGLQLDRDVRALIAYAADLTQRPVLLQPALNPKPVAQFEALSHRLRPAAF